VCCIHHIFSMEILNPRFLIGSLIYCICVSNACGEFIMRICSFICILWRYLLAEISSDFAGEVSSEIKQILNFTERDNSYFFKRYRINSVSKSLSLSSALIRTIATFSEIFLSFSAGFLNEHWNYVIPFHKDKKRFTNF